jgi:hypothetical protein
MEKSWMKALHNMPSNGPTDRKGGILNGRSWRIASILRSAKTAMLAALTGIAVSVAQPISADAAPAAKPNRIRIAYELPRNPAHQPIYEAVKERRVLERFQRFFAMLRLPRFVAIKFAGCDGSINAAYDSESASITFCYENLDYIRQIALRATTPEGIVPDDVVRGATITIFLHEMAHALFDLLNIPVLGREEDAADQVATYVLLKLERDDARSIILAVLSGMELTARDEKPTREHYADVHSLTAQRLFNVMCMAYGSDQESFAELVDKGHLPKERAEGCWAEYDQVSHAVSTLLRRHLDPARRKDALAQKWLVPAKKPVARLRESIQGQAK